MVSYQPIDIEGANHLLVQWGHKMGAINRPSMSRDIGHALCYQGHPVAVTVMSRLITPTAGKAISYMDRGNTCELSRLCACKPDLCRVAIRLWREFVFELSEYEYAISYSDNDIHNGNTYRFDGWKAVHRSRSGNHTRSGLQGRDKTIWQWKRGGFKNVPEHDTGTDSDSALELVEA